VPTRVSGLPWNVIKPDLPPILRPSKSFSAVP
jgi:hypothetical protein